MYLLGHVGSAILVWFVYEQVSNTRNDKHKLLFAIGVMLPDFLDKPIGSLFFNSGRWLGHDMFFQLLVLIIFLVIDHLKFQNKFKNEIFILYFGAVLHLVGDSQSITKETLFWPLFGRFPVGNKNGFLHGFSNPITITQEILGFIIIILIGNYEDWPKKYWELVIGVILGYLSLFVIVYSLLVGW